MRYSVLVVEDESLIAKNIAKKIEQLNPSFEVVGIASNGLEGFKFAEEYLPNVIVTDIRMPEMDGLSLAKQVHEKYPFILFVIISGYNDFGYAKEAMRYEVSNYLLKPVNYDELAITLSALETKLLASRDQFDAATLLHSPNRAKEIVELVKEYIHKNYQNQIDFTSLASEFGFSMSYLSKIFLKYSGITQSKYLRNHRLSISKQLLRNPELSIADISQLTGYLDPFHFSKTFKHVYGISPSEYRSEL
ncbi:response regulator transcription factor [Lacrimispora sp.]|uniref:response regulator transcription factor n=1 Tax=Lacrimispora sp. TaxID=2719234 RepID=UPI0028AF6B80|nr:response regulator [Lacrimispora sp.]